MIKGSCLCGKVKFQISGEPFSLSYCHCSRCRKAAGVFSAVLVGKADDLLITEGQDEIAKIAPGSEWKFERCFCGECGTSLGDMVTGDIYVVAASALDDDPKIRPTAHIHTASKPDWYVIVDDLKKFEGDYIPEKLAIAWPRCGPCGFSRIYGEARRLTASARLRQSGRVL